MKSLIALTIAAVLLIMAGRFATSTTNEQLSQECAPVGDTSYRNTWKDVYFVWEWWSQRDFQPGINTCEGPTKYLRYHPWDVAVLALVGAGIAGYVGLTNKPKRIK